MILAPVYSGQDEQQPLGYWLSAGDMREAQLQPLVSGDICDFYKYQWKDNMDPLYDHMVERMYDVMF